MGNKFEDKLDFVFRISEGMIEGHGEDSYCCSHNEQAAMVSVFDGCGGLGSRTYESMKGYTGAYIGSRLVAGAVHDWFHDNGSVKWKNPGEMLSSLNTYIMHNYQLGSRYAKSNLKIKGSMVRDLPTTAAIAIAQEDKKTIQLHVIWAGDSRVYLMDGQGLAQLTADDVQSDDAFTNLSDDGALTNVLSADGNFTLHYRNLKIDKPTVIFAASDGCFGYISSPMEFEGAVLQALAQAQNLKGFRRNLTETFHEVAGDDFTMGGMGFYAGNFQNMRKVFQDRWVKLKAEYLDLLKENEQEGLAEELWKTYRVNYERFLR